MAKRSRNNDSPKHSSGKHRNLDKHRWRNFLAWYVPFLAASIVGVIVTHGVTRLGVIVVSAISLLIYAEVLLERYIRQVQLQQRAFRSMTGAACILALVIGYRFVRDENLAQDVAPITQNTPNATPSPSPSPSIASDKKQPLEVKPEYLLNFFEEYNSAQAKKLVEPYLGKWVQITGVVIDVDRKHDFKTDLDFVNVLVLIHAKPSRQGAGVEFREQRWIERALVLKRGEGITVSGKLVRVTSSVLFLENCEIVE